jgi:hypothetical protein
MPAALVLDSDRGSADHLCQLLDLLDVPAFPAYSWRAGMLMLEEENRTEQEPFEMLFLGISDSDGKQVDKSRTLFPILPGRDLSVILVAPAGYKNLLERMEQVGARATITKPATLESVADVLMGLDSIGRK